MKHKSQAVSKQTAPAGPGVRVDARVDVRVQRTRAVIDHAFVQLLLQRTYRNLTVHDITRKAGVGRATFYAHYQSKDELLKSQLTRIIVPILRPCPQSPHLLDCTALFDHVLTATPLFRNIMSGGEGSGARVVRAALEAHVEALLESRGNGANELPRELVKRFVVSTLLTVTLHALQSNAAESPQQMQNRFARLVGTGLADLR